MIFPGLSTTTRLFIACLYHMFPRTEGEVSKKSSVATSLNVSEEKLCTGNSFCVIKYPAFTSRFAFRSLYWIGFMHR